MARSPRELTRRIRALLAVFIAGLVLSAVPLWWVRRMIGELEKARA